MAESASVRGFAAGLGGGTAAVATDKAKALAKTPRTMMTTEQETNLVATLTKQAVALEKSGKMHLAEQAYREALRTIAQRDGVGSPAAVPVLHKLVSTLVVQRQFDDAISNQKTVVAFARANVKTAPVDLINAQQELADFYIKRNDLQAAEKLLNDNVSIATADNQVPSAVRESCQSSLAKLKEQSP
jgi:tetratricopeptide (TPR) repeat protein